MMIRRMRAAVLAAGIISLGCLLPGMAADVHLGGFGRLLFGYPSESLALNGEPAIILGPSISFGAGAVSCLLWYGVDPSRTGYLCVQGAFGAPEGRLSSLSAVLQETGWRATTTGPAFLSASVSRLQWTAVGLCDDSILSSLTSTRVSLGGGVRVGPAWASLDYGVRWTTASVDFLDVAASPEGSIALSFGLETQVNPIPFGVLRHPVSALSTGFEEAFSVGCDRWDWEGQAGYVRVIDGQLGIVVEQPQQTIVQVFSGEYERCVVDVQIVPRSTGSAYHACGVVFRYEDAANYYTFEIRTDGFVRLGRMVEGQYETMSRWQATNALRSGEMNAVRVVLPGNRIIAYINGRKVMDESEISFTRGQIGVFARSSDQPGAWAAFDDVAIRRVERNIVLDPRSHQAREIERVERMAVALLSGAAAYVSAREGLRPVSYGCIALALFEIMYPSRHLVDVL